MFKWKDSYSTDIKEIDKQHKRLLEIGSELAQIVSAKDSLDHYDEIMKVLSELKKYTIYHFNYEEAMMEKYQYGDLDKHRREHQAFVTKIVEVESKDIDENQKRVSMDILIFIADWIEKHILKTDHEYKGFFHSKGVF